MAAPETSFTIFLRTVADATGITQIGSSIQSLEGRLQSAANTLNTALGAIGLGLTIRELNEYSKKALEVREQMAAWTLQVLRSKDGSAAFVDELNNLNRELADTTGTSEKSSREIERQLLLFGATREQVIALTKGIIDFGAARNVPAEQLAFVISRALAGEDIMLNRLGLHLDKEKSHAEQVNQLISQLGKTAGTAAAIEEASGGMGKLEVQTERAEIAIGNLVNTFKIPFLTQFTGSLGSVNKQINEMTASTDSWGFRFVVAAKVAAEGLRNLFNVINAIWAAEKSVLSFIQLLVLGAISGVENAAETLVKKAIDLLSGLAKSAASAANVLTAGLVNIDESKIDAAFGKLKDKVTGAGDSMRDSWRHSLDQIDRDFNDSIKQLQDTVDKMKLGGDLGSLEGWKKFLAQAEEQYKALFAKFRFDLAKAGTGVIEPSDEADRAKQATDALSNAKYRLAAAEQTYHLALEQTKALEESGAITGEEARRREIQAARDYIAELNRIRQQLPTIIALLQAMGNTQGANELRLELQKIDVEVLKLRTSMSNLTFLGQFRTQIRQLADEWSNLGKQLGQFVTQQFQNFAQAGGQIIAGLIFRTGNLKQAILQLGQQFVASLAQMLIQWVLSQTIMRALTKVGAAEDTAVATAQASAAAAAWSPAAISASIASFGTAAGVGLTAYLTSLATGSAAAVAASGFGGFLFGGWTGGQEGKFAGIVHGEEFVFSAPRVRAIGRGILEAVHSGALSFARPSYRDGGFVGPGSGGIALQRLHPNDLKVEIYNFTDIAKLNRAWAKSSAGRKILNDHSRKNRI